MYTTPKKIININILLLIELLVNYNFNKRVYSVINTVAQRLIESALK
ncbi:hypothetical protein IMAU60049_02942 [Lactiplantibacillus plantarum]|nr:hypothetical protein [Lactiplantibacillus plantarum]